MLEIPLMLRVRFDRVRFTRAVRIDQGSRDKIAIWHGMRVRKGEWISGDRLDGAPHLQQYGSAIRIVSNEGDVA